MPIRLAEVWVEARAAHAGIMTVRVATYRSQAKTQWIQVAARALDKASPALDTKNNSGKAPTTNVRPYMSHTIENTLAIPPLLSPKTAQANTKSLANITKSSRPHQTTHKRRPKVRRLAQSECPLLYRIFGNIRENRKSTPKILYNPTTYLPHQSAFLWNIQLYVGSPQTGQ